jgi:single-stranded-DNA-specific exonuclease
MGAVFKLDEARGDAAESAALNVAASVRGFVWRERLDPAGAGTALAISQRHKLPELLGRVLAARGVGLDEVPVALDPTLKALMPDPSTLRDMEKAAARIADAIARRESVAILGDYDVDGACSSALLARFLAAHGLQPRIYIPDRMTEGYGPNARAIETLARDGATLIVTLDCGTTSIEPLAAARPLGVDVVVVDHHQADERLPEVVALVNPNRQDDISRLGHLCAAGVTFMVLVAVARELRRRSGGAPAAIDLIEMLDLVALATVCDVVPLKGLNRAYVVRGLEVLRQRRNLGLKALADAAGLAVPPTAYHLGFVLGPRINAGGRIGDSGLGARLLALADRSESETEAARIAALLDKLNRERKALETAMLEEAMVRADAALDANPDVPMLIVASDAFHKGVVGLVASRLVDRFHRPACVIAWEPAPAQGGEGGLGTGSLRSIDGVDIGAAVRAAVAEGHLAKGGGHTMAAGLSVTRERLPGLEAFLAARLGAPTRAARAVRVLNIDGALSPGAVTDELMALIARAGPFGQGNPEPRFVFPAARVKFAKVMGTAHVRCVLEGGDGARLDAIAFRAAGEPLGEALMKGDGLPLHVVGHLRRDTWNGRDRRELAVEDAAVPE